MAEAGFDIFVHQRICLTGSVPVRLQFKLDDGNAFETKPTRLYIPESLNYETSQKFISVVHMALFSGWFPSNKRHSSKQEILSTAILTNDSKVG